MSSRKKSPDLALVGEPKTPKPDKLERPCFAVYDEDTRVEEKPSVRALGFTASSSAGRRKSRCRSITASVRRCMSMH